MRTLLSIIQIIILFAGCTKASFEPINESEYDWYYDSNGDSIILSIRKDRVAIKTDRSEEVYDYLKKDPEIIDYTIPLVYVVIDPLKTTLNDVLLIPGIEDACYALEVYRQILIPQNKVYVCCKDVSSLEQMISQAGLDENVQMIDARPMPGIYLITISSSMSETLSVTRKLYETGLCVWAEPNFIHLLPPNPH